MAAETANGLEGESRLREPASARCPYAVFHNVLGRADRGGIAGSCDGQGSRIRAGHSPRPGISEARIDYRRRDCLLLRELDEEFKAPVETFVRRVPPEILERLGVIEPSVEPREF